MNKASELGLWQVWAYHCMRCEHVWFPRWVSGYHPGVLNNFCFMQNLQNPVQNVNPSIGTEFLKRISKNAY